MAGWPGTANARVHGTTRQVPAVIFAAQEAPCLLPAPAERYQVPYWAQVKVHVDYHIQVARALYSVPLTSATPLARPSLTRIRDTGALTLISAPRSLAAEAIALDRLPMPPRT